MWGICRKEFISSVLVTKLKNLLKNKEKKMKYLILFILANLSLMATTPEEINFEQIDDYFRAQITGDIKQLDYHKGKLYLSYADADSHFITAFYNDLKLEEYKSKYHEYYQYGPTLNFLISNDKKSYSVNIYKTENKVDSHQHGSDSQRDDMVPVEHKIYRWSDDIEIYNNTKEGYWNIIMNSDYNYLYDEVTLNYTREEYRGSSNAGTFTSHTNTTEIKSENSENNRYFYKRSFSTTEYYYNYNGSDYRKLENCNIETELNLDVFNSIELCQYYFRDVDDERQLQGKNIKYPVFSPNENYFCGRIYGYPDFHVFSAEPSDTLVIYELPVTKEPKYVEFDSLSNIKCFSPNSNSLLMVINNQIYDFDLFTGKVISKMDYTFEHEITKIDVSPENSTLAVITHDWKNKTNNIYIFNYENYFSQIASVNEINENSISIYPNPAEDYIEININKPSEGLKPSEGSEFEIYDVLGEKVMSESIHPMTRSHRMNVGNLPKGVYFIRIGNKVEKFIKK
jgi:hypothetical protein